MSELSGQRKSDLDALLTCLGVNGDASSLRAVLSAGVDVNAKDEYGYTALHAAAEADWREDNDGRMLILLENGADLRARAYDEQRTPLMLAAAEGFASQLQRLVEWGAEVDAQDSMGLTPLMLAVDQSLEPEKKVNALLEAGADVSFRDHQGMSALDLAQQYHDVLRKIGSPTSEQGRIVDNLRKRSRNGDAA